MIVKKFQAPTETEAVLKAKEELGSNAVVLNVKTLKQRGIFRLFKKDVVEITAALEENEFIHGIKERKPVLEHKIPTIDYVADEPVKVHNDKSESQGKPDSLHHLLQNQMDSQSIASAKTQSFNQNMSEKVELLAEESDSKKVLKERESTNFKFLQMIYKKLIDNEVDEKYANVIIGEIENSLKKEANIDSILSGVYQKIILKLGEPKTIAVGKKPNVVFFIGPTGVGKTTTIAKLASMYKLEKHCKVAFITSDTYRIAAVEQLNTYASIIDCPISVIYSADELEDSLEQFKEFDLIMVDTAGRSHKSEEQMTEIMDLYNKVKTLNDTFDIEVYLTLSITTKYKDLVRIADAYKDVPEWRVIFTKLDETCSLGNILNMKLLTNSPLSYTTSGQNVPTDIEVINEQGLAKQLLGGNE